MEQSNSFLIILKFIFNLFLKKLLIVLNFKYFYCEKDLKLFFIRDKQSKEMKILDSINDLYCNYSCLKIIYLLFK